MRISDAFPIASEKMRSFGETKGYAAVILKEFGSQIDQTMRALVERKVDVPEAEEFGAIDHEFRDAASGQHDPASQPCAKNKTTAQGDTALSPASSGSTVQPINCGELAGGTITINRGLGPLQSAQ
jgi:hypothetical protein